MIILDNIIFSLQKTGGISVVWKHLIEQLNYLTDSFLMIDYKTAENNMFRKEMKIDKAHRKQSKSIYPSITQIIRPNINYNDPFIFHSSYFRTCKNPNAINVTTVHDFIYEQGKPNLKQKLRIKLNYKAIRNSDAIVCISENTKKDLFKFLPDIDAKKVYVIHNGVSEDYKQIVEEEKYRQYKDYVLFVGGRYGYKNFNFVIKTLKDSEYKLLICGSPLSEKEIELLDENLSGRYENIVFPSNQELNRIYNSVYALAYPSSYEGFGIPVLEAQRAGCPVIAMNASSIPEIIGETPLLMKEVSKQEFIEKLSLLKEDKRRHQIIEAGLINSRRFSWKKMASEYFALYNSLLAKRQMF